MRVRNSLVVISLIFASSLALADENRHECHMSTDYDIKIDENSVLLSHTGRESLRFSGEQLLVDGKPANLNDQQRRAVVHLQQGARRLVPQFARLAVEGGELGVKAATLAITALLGDDVAVHDDLIKPIEAISHRIQENITDDMVNSTQLEKAFDQDFEREIEQLVSTATTKYSGKMIGHVLRAAFSGDDEEMNDLEFRMENLGEDIERQVEAEAKQLEARADELCEQMQALEQYDQQLVGVEGYPKQGVIVVQNRLD